MYEEFRNVYREFLEDSLSWSDAYQFACERTATSEDSEEIEFYSEQMHGLSEYVADKVMQLEGYKLNNQGYFERTVTPIY